MEQHVTVRSEPAAIGRRRSRWKLVVTAGLVMFLGVQAVAGWKFFNGETYPVVGSGMFSGPPNAAGDTFLVPRVFGDTTTGERVELDQHTFHLEPFEWRRWIKRHIEDASPAAAQRAAAVLSQEYSADTGIELLRLEVWRIPAVADDADSGRLVGTFAL